MTNLLSWITSRVTIKICWESWENSKIKLRESKLPSRYVFPCYRLFRNALILFLKQTDGGKASFENVRKELKQRGLTEQEIEMIFAKYDIDNNRELDERELAKLFSDLEGKKSQLENEIKNTNRPSSALSVSAGGIMSLARGAGIPPEEMAKVVRRVDRMEYTLSVIASKIDSVLEGKLIIPTKKSDLNDNEEE